MLQVKLVGIGYCIQRGRAGAGRGFDAQRAGGRGQGENEVGPAPVGMRGLNERQGLNERRG